MEKEPQFNKQESEQGGEGIKIIDGKKYRRVSTGYTMREFFSHETLEKGPGPGWDSRWKVLEEYGVDHPSKLPDEPYYQWELVE
ncbi:MAG: hypothetical protein HY452_02515 [Parcubacteria group bacterium]|nr:hypothetical protein [Parcubacteria group bacterium]